MRHNTKKTFRIYWQEAKLYPWSLLATLIVMSGVPILEAIIPLYFRKFFNLLAEEGNREVLFTSLSRILVIIIALLILQWFLRRLGEFISNYFQSHVIANLSNRCFAYLHLHSFSYFNNNFIGSLVKKVKWFTGAFERICDRTIWHFIPLIISISLMGTILFRVNAWLGIGVLVWVLGFLGINWFFVNYKIKFDVKRNEAETANSGLLADTLTNNVNVKLFNGYRREVENFESSSEEVRKWRKFSWDMSSLVFGIQGLLIILLEVIIYFYALYLWRLGEATIGDFALIQAYLIEIFNRVWDFGHVIKGVYEDLADAEEMTEVLETPHEIKDVIGAKILEVKERKIEFKDVSFNYHETRPVLKSLNLEIKPGETLAVIGPSGAGKTTLIKLLFRMHDLTAGQILIDGQDIAKVTQESLREAISLVPQDPLLFHRSLKENIRYGRPEATDEEVIEAAKLAHCHEFISSFPEGYDTHVGERGVKLSGGERQRVAIARAILRNAPILVLDEATSSLDSESERLIQEALDNLMKDKTVIVIAHRLSTIRKANRIIVVEDGQIIEEGTHQQLIAEKESGLYKKLWSLQAEGFIGAN